MCARVRRFLKNKVRYVQTCGPVTSKDRRIVRLLQHRRLAACSGVGLIMTKGSTKMASGFKPRASCNLMELEPTQISDETHSPGKQLCFACPDEGALQLPGAGYFTSGAV